jgi:uncharacterized membrane protein YhhN
MNESFKDWALGATVFVGAATVLYTIGRFISPTNHFNLLEWWGLVMMAIIIRSGYITYNEELEEDDE